MVGVFSPGCIWRSPSGALGVATTPLHLHAAGKASNPPRSPRAANPLLNPTVGVRPACSRAAQRQRCVQCSHRPALLPPGIVGTQSLQQGPSSPRGSSTRLSPICCPSSAALPTLRLFPMSVLPGMLWALHLLNATKEQFWLRSPAGLGCFQPQILAWSRESGPKPYSCAPASAPGGQGSSEPCTVRFWGGEWGEKGSGWLTPSAAAVWAQPLLGGLGLLCITCSIPMQRCSVTSPDSPSTKTS